MYAVKEIFYTIQGEGAHAGSPAVFVRFAGCNLWSGREEDRYRDAPKGACARWCDTDFRGADGVNGGRYSAQDLAALATALWPSDNPGIVVLTGGEPTLQVDGVLVDALHAARFRVHMETNGTRSVAPGVDWVTVSPKPPSIPLAQVYHEVKVVLCGRHDPEQWVDLAPVRSLQPLWNVDEHERSESLRECIQYILKHPHWHLSLQTHKLTGLP